MNLRQKVYSLFDVVIPEGSSNKAVIKELNRRGKLDLVKLTAIVFLLLDEIEELKQKPLKK